jgi:hypothetical protein
MNAGARMATSQSADHLLIVRACIRRAPVRVLLVAAAAAAAFTRCDLGFNLNFILHGATLKQRRNLRTGLPLYLMKGSILVQKLPLLVTSTFDFISLPY